MAEATFGAILDKQSSEVDRPKPLPQGSYHCVVDGQYEEGKTTNKGTEYIAFSLKPISALDDVDEEELNTSLTSGDGSVRSLQDKRITATFYLTENALWRLKKFLVDDLQIPEGKKKIRQLVSEAQN